VASFQHWTTVVMYLWIPLTQHTVHWPVYNVIRVTTPVLMLSPVLRMERGLPLSVWLLVSVIWSIFWIASTYDVENNTTLNTTPLKLLVFVYIKYMSYFVFWFVFNILIKVNILYVKFIYIQNAAKYLHSQMETLFLWTCQTQLTALPQAWFVISDTMPVPTPLPAPKMECGRLCFVEWLASTLYIVFFG